MSPPGRRRGQGVDLRFPAPTHGAAAAEGIAEQAAQAIGVVPRRRVQRQKPPRDARPARERKEAVGIQAGEQAQVSRPAPDVGARHGPCELGPQSVARARQDQPQIRGRGRLQPGRPERPAAYDLPRRQTMTFWVTPAGVASTKPAAAAARAEAMLDLRMWA